MTSDLGWRMLGKMLRQQKERMLGSFVFTVLGAITELIPFGILYLAIDMILNNVSVIETEFPILAGWMILSLFIKALFYAIAYYLSHEAAFNILTETRRQLVAKLANAPLEWLQQNPAGKIKHTILQDVENIENFIAHHTVEVLASAVGPIVVTIFLFWIDWRLAMAALLIAPIAVLSSTLFMSGLSEEYLQYNESEAKLDSTTVEYLRNMPVMKLFQQDSERFLVMRNRVENYYSLINKLTRRTIPGWALFNSLLGASVLTILPVGIYLYEIGEVSSSTVILVILLGAGMLKPLLKISRFFMEINEVLAGMRKIAPIMQISEDNRSQYKIISQPIQVKFENVNFSYEQNHVAQEVDLVLTSGSFNVLLGPSGAGKTTIAQMLAGLTSPSSGSVSLNGHSVHDLSNKQRCELIAVATQEAFLFKGTIRENLLLARTNATDGEILTALKVAQADTLIRELPDGLETHIHEQGVRLSGGEKQRIAIARAFLANTPIVVLDEASASLDNLTQQAFYNDINTFYPDKTFLVIAHRSYGVDLADQIIVMENGRISGVGKHANLLKDSKFYRRLWFCQKESEHWSLGGKLTEDSAMEMDRNVKHV
ncbi:MAG: ATP-binding cassette subfamily B protein IrtA [Paraglaciecola sp.]|jgi:ATP-binding cassette subfamily B protein IrtA